MGSFRANAWGLHDMIGNASEWTADSWHDDYEGAPSDGRARLRGGEEGWRVAVRGGGYRSYPQDARVANRGSVRAYSADQAWLERGVRLAQSIGR